MPPRSDQPADLPPASPALEAVIFDLGRVLVDYDWAPSLRQASQATGTPPDQLARILFQDELFHAFERGQLAAREFHERLGALLHWSLAFPDFVALWNSIFSGEIALTCALALRLHRQRRIRVAILSNTNELHAAYLRGRFAILKELPHVFLSNEIGQRKPDRESFDHVLETLGVKASRAVFVDDMPENIQAAQRLGLHAVLASSPEAVQEGLSRLRIG